MPFGGIASQASTNIAPSGGALQAEYPGGPLVQSPNTSPTSIFGNPATFTAAANTQASDYDSIMASYGNLVKNFAQNPISTTNITPQLPSAVTTPYNQSSDVTGSLASLSNLTQTGGYGPGAIQALQAQALAPVRGAYAAAQQNLNQNRALEGGYSPNYAAATAQLTRSEADSAAQAVNNAFATIAQNQATNEISAAPAYANAAQSANQTTLGAAQANTNIVNQINQANAQRQQAAQQSNQQANLAAQQAQRASVIAPISGQASLYGTTPALTNTFGNQVVQASQLGQNQQALNQKNLALAAGAGGISI
jgi:hypothetical protein